MSSGYKALHETAAWMDLSGRGKIRVTGEDRARLLHAMCSQDIQSMKPGEGGYVFFLNAQGRILADANIFCFVDHFLLDTEPETARKVFEHLDRYIIADDVTLTDETGTTATFAIEGPQAEGALHDLLSGVKLPEADYQTVAWEDRVIAKVSSTAAPGFFIFLPDHAKSDLAGKLANLAQADAAEARVARIENGRPRYGEEITERYLIQETGQLRGVHFNKGCYLGQEIVERVRSRAQIHRVLRRLEMDTTEVPTPGTKLTLASSDPPGPGENIAPKAADAGEIASGTYSPALGKVVALAYVRTPYAEPGTIIDTGTFKALVT
jgi:folate-binding protein YgfZ